jgi:predicted AlkP superfamily pyrophosphatase or phosphodiesterase
MFVYGNSLINAVQNNNGKLKPEMCESLNLTDTASEAMIQEFEKNLAAHIDAYWVKKGIPVE